MKLSDLIDFNPKRPLEKGALTPFIEMADLPEGERDVSGIGNRVFNGGGSKFKNGDTLFARITPCLENGKTAKVSGLPENDVGHGSTEFIVMAAKDPDVDEDFVYYVARHPEFRAYAKGRMEGTSGRQRVSWQAIADYEIPDFSGPERSGIGSVLSSMDNFISNNRRVNQALEAMARALFKAWFVDFEPVRAKLEGRWQRGQSLPGMPAHLYDLFPDRLVESELGEIPQGWEVKKIGDVITRLSVGKKYEQKTVSSEGCVPVLDQGKSGIIGYHNDEPGVAATADAPVVVFANHTCYMRLISFSFSAIQNVLPFIGKDVSTIWAYYATFGKQSFVEYKGHWPDFVIHDIAIPPSNLTEQFAKFLNPWS